MHLNVDNFFSQYLPQAEEVTLKDGNVVKLKKLSYGQSQAISNESIDGIDHDGNPEINFKEAQRSKLKKISQALVEPKMTVKQLESLTDNADDIIQELFEIVDPKTAELMAKNAEENEAESKDGSA